MNHNARDIMMMMLNHQVKITSSVRLKTVIKEGVF